MISSNKKPGVYIRASERALAEQGMIKLSALGAAMSSLVTVAEVLKDKGMVVEKAIMMSLEEFEVQGEDSETVGVRKKPKLEAVFEKSEAFDELYAAQEADRARRRQEREELMNGS